MAEVVITVRRPPSMTSVEMQAWVIDRALVRRRALALCGPESAATHTLLLRVEVDDDAVETAEEELTDLMLDMRRLGFRPAVLPHAG